MQLDIVYVAAHKISFVKENAQIFFTKPRRQRRHNHLAGFSLYLGQRKKQSYRLKEVRAESPLSTSF